MGSSSPGCKSTRSSLATSMNREFFRPLKLEMQSPYRKYIYLKILSQLQPLYILFVCLYGQVQVRGHNFSHKLLGCKCLLQSLYLLTPCLTWDSVVHGLMQRRDLIGAPVSWEMSLGDEHRNQTLPLQLGHFSWLFSSPRVFGHQQIIR